MDRIKKFEPIFGVWHAEALIGVGSFGRVYRICREELGHRYYSALKYISLPTEASEIDQLRSSGMDVASISDYYGAIARDISREAAMMDSLRACPNIVAFDDSRIIPKENGVGYDIFIRMELLESLTSKMITDPLSESEIIRLGKDICSALVVCSAQGILHRDIKPDNIFVSSLGTYKLGDFGIARHLEKTTTFMSRKGTYNYMAPEVYKGEKYGPNADVYSLGMVMYRLLNNNRLPFLPQPPQPLTPSATESALTRRLKGELLPAPANASPRLSRIILKACEADPARRYASAQQMLDDLNSLSSAAKKPMPVFAPLQTDDRTVRMPDFPTRLSGDKTPYQKPKAPEQYASSAPQQGISTVPGRNAQPKAAANDCDKTVSVAHKPMPAPQEQYVPPVSAPEPAPEFDKTYAPPNYAPDSIKPHTSDLSEPERAVPQVIVDGQTPIYSGKTKQSKKPVIGLTDHWRLRKIYVLIAVFCLILGFASVLLPVFGKSVINFNFDFVGGFVWNVGAVWLIPVLYILDAWSAGSLLNAAFRSTNSNDRSLCLTGAICALVSIVFFLMAARSAHARFENGTVNPAGILLILLHGVAALFGFLARKES